MLPIDLRASAGGRLLRLQGELAGQSRFLGRVELEGPPPASLRLPGEEGSAALTASVLAEDGQAGFDDIEFRYGTIRAHGQGSISLDGPRPAARVALAAARIDLPAPSRDIPVWQRRPLETAVFGESDLDFELKVGALSIGDEELDDLRLELSLAPEAWVVKAGRAGWRGGRLAFDGYLKAGGRTLMKMRLRDAVLPVSVDFGPSGARTDGFLALEAEGRSPHALVSTAFRHGAARFHRRPAGRRRSCRRTRRPRRSAQFGGAAAPLAERAGFGREPTRLRTPRSPHRGRCRRTGRRELCACRRTDCGFRVGGPAAPADGSYRAGRLPRPA